MPISEVEMFELMEKALAPATSRYSTGGDEWRPDQSTSNFNEPITPAEICTLEDLLAGQSSFLHALARYAEVHGTIATANAAQEVADFLAERAEDLETPEKPLQRLKGFVYPVV